MNKKNKLSLHDLTFDELNEFLSSLGVKSFRAKQVWQGLYHQLWQTYADFSTIPKTLREQLEANFTLEPLTINKTITSRDHKTEKSLIQFSDGKTIETVLMKYDTRNTICISTQVGCAMNCDFCATGQMGFFRDLSTSEIVEQVLIYARQLNEKQEKITNIVIMGMGEPFNNYQNTMRAIDILNDQDGFKFGERRITISTVGIIPEINRFAEEHRQVNLAISLHTANNDLRNQLVPINKKYPIEDLIAACKNYLVKTRRRLSFEYALIEGINDSEKDAKDLANLLRGMLAHVNLIPLNSTPDYKYSGSSRDTVDNFKNILDQRHIPCSIRMKRGSEIIAGCGQLVSKSDSTAEQFITE